MAKELLSTRKYKIGYEVRKYRYSEEDAAGGPDMIMRSAFTTDDGYYVGNPKWAYRIFRIKGLSNVQPSRQAEDVDANGGWGYTCSVGYSRLEERWFGWSHRAMYGFGVGSEVKKGDCAYVPNTHTEMWESARWAFEATPIEERGECYYDPRIRNLKAYIRPGALQITGEREMQHYAEEPALDGALVPATTVWEPFSERYQLGKGEWTAETLSDAKEMACAFAQSVS